MHFSILRKDTTASTNDDVWELAAQGAPEGSVVVARSQKQGRGQWGRVWVSPEGGLYFSLLLRPTAPQSEWPQLSSAIARAVCRVVRMECGVDPGAYEIEAAPSSAEGRPHEPSEMSEGAVVSSVVAAMKKLVAGEGGSQNASADVRIADSIHVKHPNDVVCDAGKICGISLEARNGCVVIGCGVNVFHPDRPIETDGRNTPAYLVDVAEGRLGVPNKEYLDALLDALLASIDAEVGAI